MTIWTAIVAIVAIGCFASIMTERYKALGAKRANPEADDQLLAREKADAEREVTELRERIKVLERIATSDRESKQIASEIENLRDK